MDVLKMQRSIIDNGDNIIRAIDCIDDVVNSVSPYCVSMTMGWKAFLSDKHNAREYKMFFYDLCDRFTSPEHIPHFLIDEMRDALINHIYGIECKEIPSSDMRDSVIQNANGLCNRCGRRCENLTLDHIIAKKYVNNSFGIANYQALCRHCNSTKGTNRNWSNFIDFEIENEEMPQSDYQMGASTSENIDFNDLLILLNKEPINV